MKKVDINEFNGVQCVQIVEEKFGIGIIFLQDEDDKFDEVERLIILIELCRFLMDDEIVNNFIENECRLDYSFVCIVEEVEWFMKEFIDVVQGN